MLLKICSLTRAVWTSAVLVTLLPAQNFLQGPDRSTVVIFDSPGPVSSSYEDLIETFALTRTAGREISFLHIGSKPDPQIEFPNDVTAILVRSDQSATAPFRNSLERLKSRSPQARVTVIELSAPNADNSGGVPVDVPRAFAAASERARAMDAGLAAAAFPNGAPKEDVAAILIGGAVLQSWHAPPLVSAVEINALRGIVTRSENTTVRELENDRVLAWTEDDQALPAAADIKDPPVLLALRCSGFANLNEQTLRITGMSFERYALTIDGEPMGTFHRDQLDAGLNLALMPTPMWRQAMEALQFTRRLSELRAARGRLMEAPAEQHGSDAWQSAMDALKAEEDDVANERQSRLKPKTHDYELQPVER